MNLRKAGRYQSDKRARLATYKADRKAVSGQRQTRLNEIEAVADTIRSVAMNQHGIELRLDFESTPTPTVRFFKQRFNVATWWPTTERLKIGNLVTTSPSLADALEAIGKALAY